MVRKEDIKWTSDMIEKYEELLTCIPAQARKFVGKNILYEIAKITKLRGLDTVDTSAIVNGFLLNTPAYFRALVERKMYEVGFNPTLYENDMPKRDLVQLKNDILLTCKKMGFDYDEENISMMLNIFEPQFAYMKAPISFRSTTKGKQNLSYRFVNLFLKYDPYRMIVGNELIEDRGHKIHKFIQEIQSKERIQGYGMDFGASTGFEKIWVYFPFNIRQNIKHFAMLNHAPQSLEYNLNFFQRYNLNEYYIAGFDFIKNSMNIYFMTNRIQKFGNKMIRDMLTDLGMTYWTEHMIELCTKAVIVYFTVTWDSLKIERVCFGVTEENLEKIPYELSPFIKDYVDATSSISDNPKYIYGLTFGRNMNYTKIENDYSGTMVDYLKGVHNG